MQNLWELLEEAKAKEVWRTLDCKNWTDYVTHKLDMSRVHSYRLLNQATVIRELEAATQVEGCNTRVTPDITVREAQRLKPVLPQVKAL